MGVILKHTLRNIFAKPLIMIFLVISITVCAFAGMMAFDMSNSLEGILKNAFASMFGKANVEIEATSEINEADFEDLPEHEACFVATKDSKLCVRSDDMYAYYNEKKLVTQGVDIDEAASMNLVSKKLSLEDDECVITKTIAKDMGLEKGDTFTIYGDNNKKVDFKVKEIASLGGLLSNDYNALVTEEGIAKLSYDGKCKYTMAFVKVENENEAAEFCDKLEDKMPTAYIENLVNGKMVKEQISQISGIFMFLFIITLLLVIFVTVTLSERIMIDRLSTIGTLRSLGISPGLTARVILVENMFYGLFGGVLGTVLYLASRDSMFSSLFTIHTDSDLEVGVELGEVSVPVIIGVILGAMIVEMICPLRELLKATGKPIRDIIFDNRDTEYKYRKKYLVLSIVSGILAAILIVITFAAKKDMTITALLGFLLVIVSVFSGYPFILKKISEVLEKISIKINKPIFGLAATSLRTKKTCIGSSKLTFIATTLSLVLFVCITAFQAFIVAPPADADVIVTGLSETTSFYDYFEDLYGVEAVEFKYYKYGDKLVVGKENIDEYLENKYIKKCDDYFEDISIIGTEGQYELDNEYIGLPEKIKDDEIYLTKKQANKLNLKVGDTAEFLLNSEGVVPKRTTLTVAGIIDSSNADSSNTTAAISLNLYKEVYMDSPAFAYIKTNDAEITRDLIRSYSSGTVDQVRTMDEYIEESKTTSAGILTLLYMIIIMGVSLTLIGVFCNQIVGFESRKRESAVLISTAMSRTGLIKLFANENFISSGISISLAVIVGAIETVLMYKLMSSYVIFGNDINIGKSIGFLVVIFFTFSITIVKTITSIRKMKISEQLKYE